MLHRLDDDVPVDLPFDQLKKKLSGQCLLLTPLPRGQGCNFFHWIDPRMCERLRTVIPELLRKVKKHEELQRKVATRGRIMWIVLLGSWVTVLVLLLVLFGRGSKKHVPSKNVRLELEF
ncbi:hypothetical protein GBA52_024309 [Prunus armeniaca]|nr:hypothetical protein GBA52_024309 [Prunus armeniaca]